MTILFGIISILTIVLLFGGTIFVHELGHFLTAKWCGLRIDAFSIGMGPPIWQKKVNGVVYKVCWLPLGGYVALPQMDPTGSMKFEKGQDNEPDIEIPPVAPWKRIVVAVAGATMNVGLALILSTIVWKVGMDKNLSLEQLPCILGTVEEESHAAELGLESLDQIISVNGKATPTIEKVFTEIALSDEVKIGVLRNGVTNIVSTTPRKNQLGMLAIEGFYLYTDVTVGDLLPNLPAAKSGLKKFDKIRSVNGSEIYGRGEFINAVAENEDQSILLGVERPREDGTVEKLDITLTPEFSKEHQRAMIGIAFLQVKEYPTPKAQIKYYAGAVFRTLSALTDRDEAKHVINMVQGPVGIATNFWSFLQIGLIKAIWFTALININLAILNLLPVPILDGSHIVYALIEILTGRKMAEKLVLGLTNAFMILLISFIMFVTYKDIWRQVKTREINIEAREENAARREARDNARQESPAAPETPAPAVPAP
ncbi:MAG: regulator of sigma E protease [Candidatus Omnitrophota bacterium]|jgi:regulator of sigma E protease